MSLLREAISGAEERKAQEEKREAIGSTEEKREAIKSTVRGASFRGIASSAGTVISGFFAYIHLEAANVMGAEAAGMLTEGRISVAQYVLYHKLAAAATDNYIVGALFAVGAVVFLAYAVHNFKDLRQAKRP